MNAMITMRWLLLLLSLAAGSVPAQPGTPPKTPAEKARHQNEAGVQLYESGDYAGALVRFEAARQHDPKSETIAKNLARALHARAVDRVKAEELDGATADLDRALGLDRSEPAFSVLLARVWQSRDRNGRAREVLVRALKDHPSSSRLFEGLGRLEYAEEFLQEALECLEKAARLDPKRASTFAKFLEKVRREARVEKRYFKDVKGKFTVKYDDRKFQEVGAAVLDVLDRKYNEIASDLGHWPRRQLSVVLYTRGDYDTATGAHKWTGGLFDGKIRLPVRNYRSVTRQIEATLTHELTHWFVRDLASRRCPLWLNEGIAQLQEGKKPGAVTRRRVQAAHRSGRLKKVQDLPKSWAGLENRDTVSLYYAQALEFSNFLVRRYGWSGLSALLVSLGSGKPLGEAFEAAFRVRLEAVEADWLRQME